MPRVTVTVARIATCANRQTTRSDRLATVRSLDERSKRYRSTPLFRPRVASTEPSMMGRTTWAMVIPARQARVGSGADTQELRGAVPALPNSHLGRAEVWCQCRLSFPSGPLHRCDCPVLRCQRRHMRWESSRSASPSRISAKPMLALRIVWARARRTIAGVRCPIDGAPICCMAARVSLQRISRTARHPADRRRRDPTDRVVQHKRRAHP